MAENDLNDPAAGDDPVYAYKPLLVGAPWEFRLRPEALEWQGGGRKGRAPYGRIARVRLSYRPASMQARRFLMEIWPSEGSRVSIASSSWRSLVELAPQDQAYGAFVREFNRRLAAAGAKTSFETGSPAILYWPGLAIMASATATLAVLMVQALLVKNWSAAALIAGFCGLFAWQGGTFFWRNLPGRYRPDALPSRLVPPA